MRHEPAWQFLRQSGDGEFLLEREERCGLDSCGEAKMALFDYVEVFYNQRRRHSTLGQISPAAFERRATAA